MQFLTVNYDKFFVLQNSSPYQENSERHRQQQHHLTMLSKER